MHRFSKTSAIGSLLLGSLTLTGCVDEGTGGRGTGMDPGFSSGAPGTGDDNESGGGSTDGGNGGEASGGESGEGPATTQGGTTGGGSGGPSGTTDRDAVTTADPGSSGEDGTSGAGGTTGGASGRGVDTMGSDAGGGTDGLGSGSGTTGEDTTSGGLVGSTGDATSGGGSGSGLRFDVGGDSGELPEECDRTGPGTGVGGDVEFSYIWISNMAEGTVSKIDTMTGVEQARYRTGPDLDIGGVLRNPDPSRTSVNLYGDVAIANRAGSLTKIAAREEDCIDRNGNMQIETSTGPNDVLDWMEDECVLWWVDLPYSPSAANTGNRAGPRAVAWDGGSGDICDNDAKVWVAGRTQEDSTTATVQRYTGDGAFDAEVVIDGWTPSVWGHGPYGGATDAQGNLWVLGANGYLVFVDATTLTTTRYDIPNGEGANIYGFALDANGDIWIGGWNNILWRFDVATRTYHNMATIKRLRGVAIDFDGQLWAAGNGNCSLVHYDTVTQTVVDSDIDLPDCNNPVGVSVDVDGYVWVVDRESNRAYKVNPTTHVVENQTLGLNRPYTYSDMTGAGLSSVVGPPG